MIPALKQIVYDKIIQYPAKSDYDLVDILKRDEKIEVDQKTVWRTRQKLVTALDYELARKVAGKFLSDFQMASEYWRKQIDQLEEQKTKPNFITVKGKDGPEQVEVPKSDGEIREIMKQQEDLWKNILFLARQGEAVEVMRLMQSGRIPALSH